MELDFQGSQKMHVRVATSQNELVKNFQNLYLNDHNNLKLLTLQSVKVVIAPRLEAPPGTMCIVLTLTWKAFPREW